MTVAELIQLLQELPQDAEVVDEGPDHRFYPASPPILFAHSYFVTRGDGSVSPENNGPCVLI